MWRFLNPEFLWLLLLIPLMAIWKGRRGMAPALEYSDVNLAREAARVRRFSAGRLLMALRFPALALMILALARPQLGQGRTEIEASGIDIVLAIDISGSMQAMDFKLHGRPASRLDVVKSVVSQFIDERTHDRIGLVVFAGAPYMVSPLTLDHSWLQQNLDRVQIGTVEDGTAIGSGLAASVNRLRNLPSKSRLVILLTDGVNNAGKVSPEAAADAARAMGIKTYTIAAGSKGEVPFPVKDPFGNTIYRYVKMDVDEEILKKISDLTGARSFRATDTDSLRNIYAEIDRMEKSTVKVKKFEQYQELFPWFLIPGLFLVVGEACLFQTRFRRLP